MNNKWIDSRDKLPTHDEPIWVTVGIGCVVHETTFQPTGNGPHILPPSGAFFWQPRVVTDKPTAMRGALNPKEFLQAIRDCDNGDPERDHAAADEVMMDLLRHLGYGEGVAEFDRLSKYYA